VALKQGLQLKLGQSLTMTPQLQQAIRLLQLSALDLQQEIQEVLEANPMLEMEDEFGVSAEHADGDAPPEGTDNGTTENGAGADGSEGATAEIGELSATPDSEQTDFDAAAVEVSDTADQLPDDLPVDTDWDDLYQPSTAPASSSGPSTDFDYADINSAPESLRDNLYWQLNLLKLSDTDRLIAELIIDSINPDGMLGQSIQDLTQTLRYQLGAGDAAAQGEDDPYPDAAEVEAVLKMIQQFEPAGIGARDLRECLLLQLAQIDADTPSLRDAQALVDEHLELLGARDLARLKRVTRLSEDALTAAVTVIQTLNPRPGSILSAEETEYVVPDVLVRKDKGRWKVELNPDATPRLRINDLYAGMVKRADNSRDNTFMKDNLQEAKWFMKSLQSRHETLLKVATKIVEHQRGFLDYGPEAMKPLVLHDIADAVEMHESTISRVTSRKYMHTPRGIFELKYFFSSHVGTTTGGEVSSTAIRALIKKLTEEEDAKKPLSDSKLAAILKEQNIKVARRTVAKYRESMHIPPSNERKRLI
jgi:RNA polymerase sigma-54 factor